MSHHGKSKLINLKCFKLSLVEGCGSLKEEKEEAVLTMGRKLETKENKNKIKRIIENYTPALVLIPFVKFSITISQTKWRILWMKNTNHCYNVLLTMKDEIQNNERKERTSHFLQRAHIPFDIKLSLHWKSMFVTTVCKTQLYAVIFVSAWAVQMLWGNYDQRSLQRWK